MNRKKILHIVEAFGGGIFSFLVDLINSTSDEYEIIVAYGKRNQTPEAFERYFNENVKFIEVKNFDRSINLKKDLNAFFEIKKIIKEINPDIIHLHSSKAGFVGRFAANGKKVKMLYNPHGFSFLMKDTSKVKRLIYWLIEKVGTIRRCTIVGCSYGEYQEALKLTKNAIQIDNAININDIDCIIGKKNENIIQNNNLTFCTSGRIGYQKNPVLFNEIAKKFPNNKFVWIGDGEMRECLTSENIEITGWKKREEVLKLVKKYNVFLLTSLWEGMPISLLEAMYLKRICIVTNCIGNRNLIEDGRNGYIAEDLNSYVLKIQNIINGKCNINEIIENQVNDIHKKYNTDIMSKKYEGEYIRKHEK